MLVYASQCGQVPEAHKFLLGNPLFPILIPQMESWNQVLMFTLKAINTRTKINRDGELELEEGRVGDDMLSKWAAVKSFDPLKVSFALTETLQLATPSLLPLIRLLTSEVDVNKGLRRPLVHECLCWLRHHRHSSSGNPILSYAQSRDHEKAARRSRSSRC